MKHNLAAKNLMAIGTFVRKNPLSVWAAEVTALLGFEVWCLRERWWVTCGSS